MAVIMDPWRTITNVHWKPSTEPTTSEPPTDPGTEPDTEDYPFKVTFQLSIETDFDPGFDEDFYCLTAAEQVLTFGRSDGFPALYDCLPNYSRLREYVMPWSSTWAGSGSGMVISHRPWLGFYVAEDHEPIVFPAGAPSPFNPILDPGPGTAYARRFRQLATGESPYDRFYRIYEPTEFDFTIGGHWD